MAREGDVAKANRKGRVNQRVMVRRGVWYGAETAGGGGE